VEKSLADISGGEQRRLSLAILVASGANVLILDEPTNHLDIESREALEDALTAYEGAVVLVSHDRALLEAVGTRTVVCEGGELRSHPSGWAAYQRERDEREAGRQARGEAEAGGATAAAGRAQKAARRAGASPSRSSRPRRSCASSRRSSPTPPPGRRRKATRAAKRHAARSGARRALSSSGRRPEARGSAQRAIEPDPRALAGARVMLRTLTFSGSGSGALSSARSRIVAQDDRISYSAKAAPMQRRTPPPKGIQA
jgi:ATP-binding cassette subfamily F protein 3